MGAGSPLIVDPPGNTHEASGRRRCVRGQGQALHRVPVSRQADLRGAPGMLGRKRVSRVGSAQEQALRLHLVRGDERAHKARIARALSGSVQRDHPLPCGGHRSRRERGLRGVRSEDVQRAGPQLRGQAVHDAGAGRRHQARGVRHVRRRDRNRLSRRRPEEAGRHRLRQHGPLRRGMGHDSRQGQIRGRLGASCEDLRGDRTQDTRARIPHRGRPQHRALREGPRDDRLQEGATRGGPRTPWPSTGTSAS